VDFAGGDVAELLGSEAVAGQQSRGLG
jgi:hypothetical protein